MSEAATDKQADLANTLGLDQSGARRPRFLRLLVWLLVVAAAVFGFQRMAARRSVEAPRYETQPVRRGQLVITVSATGNLEPRRKVEVGSELSGTIRQVEVDYNDRVKAGQVIARLDTTRLDAQLAQSEASLQAARARLQLSKATVHEASTQSARLAKLKKLSKGEMPAASELDAVEAALARARADETASLAAITQWEATLAVNRADRAKTEIRSPVDGIVLKRSVQPGQTVAATLQSPILFTLAEDLARLDLIVDVDEADVGKVREGQTATFTVDAFPDRTFAARITQMRHGSQALDGVVTYKTVLEVDNADLVLRPGMTATAVILIEKRAETLLVPNAALRFTPPAQVAGSRGVGLVGVFLPRIPPIDQRPVENPEAHSRQQHVYVLVAGVPKTVAFTQGASDGVMTEVAGGDLREGMDVVTDLAIGGR